ncbi:MAG: zinc finger domain-containing protein, partial [Candidatus Hodarchaeota archaeon]
SVYVYRRDFLQGISPLEEDFTLDYLSKALERKNRILKTVMIGKEAVLLGLGNSAFQEIVYKARIHPKRKASGLSMGEQATLYQAIRDVIGNRIRLGGKNEFKDLYGKQGSHKLLIGPHMKETPCPQCRTSIEKLQIVGGPTYYCPSCQKMPK